MAEKRKIVVYTSPECPNCAEAKSVASEVASELRLPIIEKDATKEAPEHILDVPTVCLIDPDGKEECVTGFTDSASFRQELRDLIGKKVTV